MNTALFSWLTEASTVLYSSAPWMRTNLILASIPLGMSLLLFGPQRRRSLLWWLGFLVFVAFLPNAPYVLTDIVHLVEAIQRDHSIWMVTLVLIPQYLLFMLAGFAAYVLSLLLLGRYLRRRGASARAIAGVELGLHGLSAIGIYLGRFDRLNSWQLLTHPHAVGTTLQAALSQQRSLLIIAITTLIIGALYWLLKQILLGLTCRFNHRRKIVKKAIQT